MIRPLALIVPIALVVTACNRAPAPSSAASAVTGGPRPSILLVTLDTTRADAIGPEAAGVQTPAFNAIAARGRRFRQAYATVPETLPSHSVDDDRPLSRRARRARERALPRRERAGRSPSGCTRRAIAPPRSCRRSCCRGASASRAGSTSTTIDCRRGSERAERTETTDAATAREPGAERAARQAALHLGPLLRCALSLCAAGAVPQPLREAIRISAKWRRWTSRSAGSCRPSSGSATGPAAIVIVGRPRRRPRRARRGAARRPAVSSRRCTCRW